MFDIFVLMNHENSLKFSNKLWYGSQLIEVTGRADAFIGNPKFIEMYA